MDILRPAQEGDAHPRPNRGRLPCELGTLLLELGDDVINAADAQPDMLEPEIRRLRRCRDGLLRGNLRDEDGDPAEIEVETRPSVRLYRTDDLGAEHFCVPAGGRLRIGAAQMDVVVGEGGHVSLLFSVDATVGLSQSCRQPLRRHGYADAASRARRSDFPWRLRSAT